MMEHLTLQYGMSAYGPINSARKIKTSSPHWPRRRSVPVTNFVITVRTNTHTTRHIWFKSLLIFDLQDQYVGVWAEEANTVDLTLTPSHQ
ncbi:hypothetical protein GDO81_021840 [Engystomops pustulosus]|uniref:Uncharacterized protein n=1 Tax=Engystomops pustulosus TaxID=76066 RepID=A0AAV6Z9D1_ENGPU|nr:hypothetical protein GDO81_021840 [Engystomops pustulosus]